MLRSVSNVKIVFSISLLVVSFYNEFTAVDFFYLTPLKE